MKKSIALLCALLLAFSLLTPFAWAEDETTEQQEDVLELDCLWALAYNIQLSYPRGEIRICPAVLETENGARDVYLVTVRSLDRVARGANNLLGALRLTFSGKCQYFNLTKKAIMEYVPEGAAIVIAGHSMGGMVVQRIICDDDLTAKYEFLNAVTFGSPCVVTGKAKREGTLVRFEDADDIIPKFSLARLLSPSDYNSAVKRDCDTKDRFNLEYPWSYLDLAHNWSYYASDAWEPFDVLGTEGGSAVLKLDLDRLVALAVRNTYYFERRPAA